MTGDLLQNSIVSSKENRLQLMSFVGFLVERDQTSPYAEGSFVAMILPQAWVISPLNIIRPSNEISTSFAPRDE